MVTGLPPSWKENVCQWMPLCWFSSLIRCASVSSWLLLLSLAKNPFPQHVTSPAVKSIRCSIQHMAGCWRINVNEISSETFAVYLKLKHDRAVCHNRASKMVLATEKDYVIGCTNLDSHSSDLRHLRFCRPVMSTVKSRTRLQGFSSFWRRTGSHTRECSRTRYHSHM